MRLGKNKPQSDYERLLAEILDVFGVDYRLQVTFHDDILDHQGVGAFRVDFLLDRRDIVIELDDPSHRQWRRARFDRMRDEFLRLRGFTVVRIPNRELDDDLRAVASRIYNMTLGRDGL